MNNHRSFFVFCVLFTGAFLAGCAEKGGDTIVYVTVEGDTLTTNIGGDTSITVINIAGDTITYVINNQPPANSQPPASPYRFDSLGGEVTVFRNDIANTVGIPSPDFEMMNLSLVYNGPLTSTSLLEVSGEIVTNTVISPGQGLFKILLNGAEIGDGVYDSSGQFTCVFLPSTLLHFGQSEELQILADFHEVQSTGESLRFDVTEIVTTSDIMNQRVIGQTVVAGQGSTGSGSTGFWSNNLDFLVVNNELASTVMSTGSVVMDLDFVTNKTQTLYTLTGKIHLNVSQLIAPSSFKVLWNGTTIATRSYQGVPDFAIDFANAGGWIISPGTHKITIEATFQDVNATGESFQFVIDQIETDLDVMDQTIAGQVLLGG